MRHNDELIRQIQKDCLSTEHAHHCSSIFFSRKNILSTPAVFLHRDFVLSSVQIIINVWSQNKVMLFFVALIFLEEQEVKSYYSMYWILSRAFKYI